MRIQTVLSILLLLSICAPHARAAEAPDSITYQSHIKPLLRKYCVGCHAEENPEGDVSLHSLSALKAETENGKLTVANKPSESLLWKVISGEQEPQMPPEDEPAPSNDERMLIQRWIELGMPGESTTMPVLKLDVSKIDSHNKIRPVSAVAVDNQQNRIAIGRFGNVKLYPFSGGFNQDKPSVIIDQLPGKVTAIHFEPNGKRLVVASGLTGIGGLAALFSDQGELVREFQGHSDILYDAEISPDSKVLATCGYDRKIILWDLNNGKKLHELKGHNGAVYDVGFSPDGNYLVSGSADDTCKVWRVADGMRLDTLPQPLKEVYSCAFSPDGKKIVAAGADNNIRVWDFVSRDEPKINPMTTARFAHEGAIQKIMFVSGGKYLVSIANDLTVKLWNTENYQELASWKELDEVAMTAAYAESNRSVILGRMDGMVQQIALNVQQELAAINELPPLDLEKVNEKEQNDSIKSPQLVELPTTIVGTIHNELERADDDFFRFSAAEGETWVFEVNAERMKSGLDSHISIFHTDGTPVERVKLQAIRDSYFTFRGKDGFTSDDFRVFNWQEMNLDQYLYSNGEVAKLWLHPRGPDSGFRVYPGSGRRWGFFDTTPVAHALGEPCYVVQPIYQGETVVPNGLPVFTLYYENDDESRRKLGRDSRLFFKSPKKGDYIVKLRDVRGFEGPDFKYEFSIRPLREDFHVSLASKDLAISQNSAREIRFTCERLDNFDGVISIDVTGLPTGYTVTSPITIEPGQIEATGVLSATESAESIKSEDLKGIEIVASANVGGQTLVHKVDGFKKLEVRKDPKLRIAIATAKDGAAALNPGSERLEFAIRPGETIKLLVKATRSGHKGNVAFGKDTAGRNLPFAVSVANIGLNGLLIPEGTDEREFYIKADETAKPTSRLFHLKTNADGNHSTLPVMLHVRP